MSDKDGGELNDFGVRHVSRGKDAKFMENDEWGVVLPKVDKIAVIGLTMVEITAVMTESAVWSSELHLLVIMAIAGLGGYSMRGGEPVQTLAQREEQKTEDA